MFTKVFGVVAAACLVAAPARAQAPLHGVSDSEILLGSVTALSGPAAFAGVAETATLQMGIDEINAAGGIHGRKLRLIAEDAQYQVPRAVQAANKLISRDKVFLMVANIGTPMNLAIFPEQFKANIPNMFPASQARQMWLPFDRLKFVAASGYYDQARSTISWMVQAKGKKNVCALYQDTDFGKETLDGVKDQAAASKIPVAETAGYRPTDTDFTAHILKLRAAKCELVLLGSLVRDSILIYTSIRKNGWTDVDVVGNAAGYDPVVAAAPGMDGYYAATSALVPLRDEAPAPVQRWIDAYKKRTGSDPSTSAINGQVAIDLIRIGLERAGKNLSVETFIAGMESIRDYHDMFGGPEQNYSATSHQGTRSSFLTELKGGKFIPLSKEPVDYKD
ncbi:ABC transporter substrate-binding protein [Chelatococcus reniformis]|uniref:Leucine-binding protein domain-containing protein n=1 Tax=Chelatococcus reniformis TaxID=1494448 RepID=A0A916XKI6_9HYPH|nr:ABC transporter substrate-binding protein [Chelatococcus reniformis]GGC78205.1 hypothetical protein GCM10010994_40560 [Chelatococcus reniformis]